MVSPFYMLAALLGIAFLLPLAKRSTLVIKSAAALSLLFVFVTSLLWLIEFIPGGPAQIFRTAGFQAPLSINLRIGYEEAIFLTLANLSFLFGFFLLSKHIEKKSPYAYMLYLLMALGINGLILTRDLFNMFVFLEISSISVYALVSAESREKSTAAGFKYLIAGAVSSVLLLIGIAFIYRLTGNLNIDYIILQKNSLSSVSGMLAVFLVIAALVIELKPFPANGWALDVYQAVSRPFGAVLSTASTAGLLFALYKLMPLLSPAQLQTIFLFSLLAFFFSNGIACRQKNLSRMFGYSTSAQTSLIIAVLAWSFIQGTDQGFFNGKITAAGAFFLTHLLAKGGLFWLTSREDAEDIDQWKGKLAKVLTAVPAVVFVLALTGFPPFPAFQAKWQIVNSFISEGRIAALVLLLAGSLFEIYYLFRWLVKGLKSEDISAKAKPDTAIVLSWLFTAFLAAAGVWLMRERIGDVLVIAAGFAALLLLDWLPVKVKGFAAIGGVAWFVWWNSQIFNQMQLIFVLIFAGGGVLYLLASMYKKGRRTGYIPFLTLLIISLVQIILVKTRFEFFFYWELMTLSSVFLVLKGRNSRKPVVTFLMFSMLSAFLLLAGLSSGTDGGSSWYMTLGSYPLYGLVLVGAAVLIKIGSLGFHIWVPDTYAEADDDTAGFLSSTVSKVGIFVLLVLFLMTGLGKNGTVQQIVSWIGTLTALGAALMAVYQEDIKKLLAYSSISQLGYIVSVIAISDYFGSVTALYLTLNHFLFKTMLFLAVAGVIMRTGTRNMYGMGGLIKKMPLSFISVLMAIIALSGVPPLSGFGGKWFLYTALIQKGWYLQAGAAFFASSVAFLYLFRLIHSIFLGQLKDKHREVREAPLWLLIPQIVMMGMMMLFSMFPTLVLKPIEAALASLGLSGALQIEGSTVGSVLGYWNGSWVMYVTMGVFMLPLVWLMIVMRKPRKVKQFNIVYAAERPQRPETTHYAYNFFAHYQKALGFLTRPYIIKFWNGVNEFGMSLASAFRRIYSGNGQTYVLHIILTVTILYLISRGL